VRRQADNFCRRSSSVQSQFEEDSGEQGPSRSLPPVPFSSFLCCIFLNCSYLLFHTETSTSTTT
jgi:hypothetical protein